MIFALTHGRDPIPWRITSIEFRSPVKIFINCLRNTTQFHLFSLQNMFFFHSSPRDCPSKTRCNTLSMLKSQLSLCGTLNHRRLQQSMLLSKTGKDLFSWIKMDSRKYSMYMLFFSDSGKCFYSMYRFFYRFREMFLRPKLRFCILCIPSGLYIYIIFTHAFLHISVQLEGESILTAEMLVRTISKGTVLFAEMLVENNIKGEAFQLLKCLCKKQLEGGSIQTAEKLVKKNTLSRGKHSNCWNAGRKTISREKHSNCWKTGKKQFQGGSILTDEMLVKKHFKGGNILTAEMLVKSNFNGEAF